MATKIDIISGFLGAGKTTLIKKLLKEAYADEQVVLIENEFGEIGIDGGFLKEAGIQIREMNSGCICCSLVGDFGTSLKEVVDKYHPDRILIEPSGVGKLSDVIKAVQGVQGDVDIVLNSYTTVVDAKKCKMYMRNFGEFFNNQVEYAGAIIMSRTDIIDEKKAQQAMELLRGINAKAAIITTPIEKLDGKKILEVMEKPVSLEEELMAEEEVCPECGHVHEHGEHHHHDHTVTSLNKAFILGIALNVAFVVVEFAVGLYYGSMGLLSDAGHNLSDVASLLLAMLVDAAYQESLGHVQQLPEGRSESSRRGDGDRGRKRSSRRRRDRGDKSAEAAAPAAEAVADASPAADAGDAPAPAEGEGTAKRRRRRRRRKPAAEGQAEA